MIVLITPHTMVMKNSELKAIGGQQHPIIGNFGLESSKLSAINIMMVVTAWSLLLLWQCQRQLQEAKRKKAETMLFVLFITGIANILWLGIHGYYVPANIRVGLAIPMTITFLTVLLIGIYLTRRMISGINSVRPDRQNYLQASGQFVLFFMAVTVTWIMALGGYRRSSIRLFWHVTGIFRDNSPWAFTHPIGFAANVITFNTLLFWCGMIFIFWLGKQGADSQTKTGL